MSIKPPIKCPPDYSIMGFRLTECKKFGIVKGIETLADINMTNFFIPLSNYEERFLTLKAGETKKIDVSSIGSYGPLFESYVFYIDTSKIGIDTEHTYTLLDSSLTILETINFKVVTTFKEDFESAYNSSTVMKEKVTISLVNFDTNTGSITITAKNKETKYRHTLSIDNTGFGGYYPYPYITPGNLVSKFQKYNEPRIRLLFIYPDYVKTNVLAGCNCLDTSGVLKSNVKYIEYAYAGEYDKLTLPNKITVEPISSTQWKWASNSTNHFQYLFKIGDMVQIKNSTNPNLRGIITTIDGYTFTVDSPIGDLSSLNQELSIVYSPNQIQWYKMGDLFIQSSAIDISDTDYNYMQSIILRNPHNYDLPLKIFIGI